MGKKLFLVERMDGAVSVEFHPESSEDLFGVAAAITSLFLEHPIVEATVVSMLELVENDEEFKTKMEKATIHLPDFNKILKS